MFGRSTIGGATHRSRLRLALLVVAVLVVALVIGEVADQVVNSGSSNARHEAASWSAGLQPIVVRSSSTGTELAQLLTASRSAGLLKVEAMVETLTATSREEQSTLANLGIAPPSSKAASLASSMLADRAQAMGVLGASIESATSASPDRAQASADCANAASLVSSSDVAAGELLRLLRRTPGAIAPANARWDENGATLDASDCGRFVADLAENRGLLRTASLAIVAISVEPNPVRIVGVPNPTTTTAAPRTPSTSGAIGGGTAASGPSGATGALGVTGAVTYVLGPSGVLVPVASTTTTTQPVATTTTLQIPPVGSRSYLPPTSSITVQVVVLNHGDVSVGPVVVHAQLLAGAGEPSPSSDTTVNSMAPGGSAYLSVGPLSIKELGTDFTLYVSANATGLPAAVERVALAKS